MEKAKTNNQKMEMKAKGTNPMQVVRLEKVTLNCGAGSDAKKLDRSIKLLTMLGEGTVKNTLSRSRIPAFGIRINQEIGCMITLRGEKAMALLKRLLEGAQNKLKKKQISNGYFGFGIKEYIEIPGVTYSREIGVLGLDICVTLEKAGRRVALRKIKQGRMGNNQKISQEETIKFLEENFSKLKIE